MNEWLASLGVELDIVPHLVALLVAYVLALPIAWDRERNERSAGLRTFPLVAIAACGFIQATESVTVGNAEATARIVEGIINGLVSLEVGPSSLASSEPAALRQLLASGQRVQSERRSAWALTIPRSCSPL